MQGSSRCNGNAHALEIILKNDLTEIDRLNQDFMVFAKKYDLPKAICRKMRLVFDELLNNVISYAYHDQREHLIGVKIGLHDDRLMITIEDDGGPFNPFSLAAPDTELSIEERRIGGLGIHLVRNLMDKVGYQRRIDRNVVTLIKHV